MNLALDTEFNGFGGSLISMALVAEDERTWYEVLPCRHPTPWVKANVLPVLGRPSLAGLWELSASLERFLGTFEQANIIFDWPEDLLHFTRATLYRPGFKIDLPRRLTFELRTELETFPEVPHNAASDAKALLNAWMKASINKAAVDFISATAETELHQTIDRPWAEYPLGTKAHSFEGGYWTKTQRGWKWINGSTFPTPGADARSVTLPVTRR